MAWLVLMALYMSVAMTLLFTVGPDLGGFPVGWLMAAWSVLNVLDAHSTVLFVTRSGIHREGNPVARWVMRKFGVVRGLVGFKLLFSPCRAGPSRIPRLHLPHGAW